MSHFTFKNESNETYGLKLISMPPPSRAGTETESILIPGRFEPLNKIHDEYANTELEFECLVTNPTLIRSAFKWLKGQGPLVYSDEPTKYYNVISNDVIDITRISDEIRSFTVKFICSPFAYSISNDPITTVVNNAGAFNVSITNNGSMDCEPLLEYAFAGKIKTTVNGGEPFYIDNWSNATYTDTVWYSGNYNLNGITRTNIYKYTCPLQIVFIDVGKRIAYQHNDGVNTVSCELTSGKFPMLQPGTNSIVLETLPTNTSVMDGVFEHTINGVTRLYKPYDQQLYRFKVTKNERWL